MSYIDGMELRDAVVRHMDRLKVPEGGVRDAIHVLVDVMEAPVDGTEMAVASRGLAALSEAMDDYYRERSPLEEQLEYVRMRKELADQGIDIPAWEDLNHE